MLILLTVCISSIIAITYLGYSNAQRMLNDNIFNQLISLRESKAYQIETYFKDLRAQVETIGQLPTVVESMKGFKEAYRELEKQSFKPEWNSKLTAFYQEKFLPRLSENVEGKPLLFSYLPGENKSRYLQYHYLANNPHPIGEKHFFKKSLDGTKYSKLHGEIQSIYLKLIDVFGYYDMFLIDIDTGDIVYSVEKQTDFATNIYYGPYTTTSLGDVVREIQKSPDPGFVAVGDFETYRASYAKPAAFLATPIYNNFELIGILAFQISIDQINKIMTGNQNWENSGLGKTGETYLVGSDRGMRSISRFLVEDADKYLNTLKARGTPERELNQIEKLGTSILNQKINTTATKKALAGEIGIDLEKDYRGVMTLSSFRPLNLYGLDWAIVAQMDMSEAFAPIIAFQKQVLIYTTIIVLIVTAIAVIFAHYFVRPINTLMDGFKKVGGGQTNFKIQVKAKDEFRQLANSFNEMLDNLHNQQLLIKKKNLENENLLLNILPEPVAKRLKDGEQSIADSFSNVTVLFADLPGFNELSSSWSPNETVNFLNDLINAFDEAAERYGVEKVKTLGSGYMAVSGLSVPRIDHTKRVVDFAINMVRILHSFNREITSSETLKKALGEQKTQLKIRIGINSGEVIAGIVGRSKFIYDLWGDTVNIAHQLQMEGVGNEIHVTEAVYSCLVDLYEFKSISDVEIPGKGKVAIWSIVL
ncbi:MAG: adenylate/guanylate cyclase domain-containing protein [Xenococcaceae cyanobacterium MO_167.B52]|nr:adenylate/guanylate cyclase domain-containing protein [Xenococcaceae cyanobacterium MO_167.B52]